MIEKARRWRVLAGGVAAAAAGVMGFAGSIAAAEPIPPQPPGPGPAIVTQTVTVTPGAAPLGASQPGTAPMSQPGAAPAAGAATPAATAPAPAPAPSTIVPAASGTLSDFFREHGVALEPQNSRDLTALNVVLPMPRGWSQVPDPNVPDAFGVIADRVGGNGLYSSNAQVVVYKLVGEFDPKEAISHGLVDSQQLPAWRSTGASLADFNGMPSSLIEGTYRENAMTLNTSRRHVIATSGPDRYLVSLSVTTSVDQAIAAADATDAIVTGFRVNVPAAAPAPPPPGAPPLPGTTRQPHLPGLPR